MFIGIIVFVIFSGMCYAVGFLNGLITFGILIAVISYFMVMFHLMKFK